MISRLVAFERSTLFRALLNSKAPYPIVVTFPGISTFSNARPENAYLPISVTGYVFPSYSNSSGTISSVSSPVYPVITSPVFSESNSYSHRFSPCSDCSETSVVSVCSAISGCSTSLDSVSSICCSASLDSSLSTIQLIVPVSISR